MVGRYGESVDGLGPDDDVRILDAHIEFHGIAWVRPPFLDVNEERIAHDLVEVTPDVAVRRRRRDHLDVAQEQASEARKSGLVAARRTDQHDGVAFLALGTVDQACQPLQ